MCPWQRVRMCKSKAVRREGADVGEATRRLPASAPDRAARTSSARSHLETPLAPSHLRTPRDWSVAVQRRRAQARVCTCSRELPKWASPPADVVATTPRHVCVGGGGIRRAAERTVRTVRALQACAVLKSQDGGSREDTQHQRRRRRALTAADVPPTQLP
eukprot:366487-Chlamydomonas_euryale.AAC.3